MIILSVKCIYKIL